MYLLETIFYWPLCHLLETTVEFFSPQTRGAAAVRGRRDCRNAQVAVMDTYVWQAKAALLMSNSTGRTRGGVGRTQVVQARALIHEEVYGLHYIM